MTIVTLTLNGRPVTAVCEPRTQLADLIRDSFNLTGTHLGCEHGVCGACTLLIDGAPARACITYAVMCDGAEITTIEGLDDDAVTRELREAFKSTHALQCGYCTPGVLVSARDIVLRLAAPTESEIRAAMSGNLCRCTGYVGIIQAVQNVISCRRDRGLYALTDGGRSVLGPVGSGHAALTVARLSHAVRRDAACVPESDLRPPDISVPVLNGDWKPQASFDRTFLVPHPRDAVWEFFGRIEEVAACMPGVALLETPSDQQVMGRLRIKAGPISAEFRGAAEIERDVSSFSGRIVGSGSDLRSNSITRGEVRYRLLPFNKGGATRVELTIAYSLSGILTQVSRSGLVQDIATHLTARFAQNVSARLDGAPLSDSQSPDVALNAGSLLWSVLGARLKALIRLLAKRR